MRIAWTPKDDLYGSARIRRGALIPSADAGLLHLAGEAGFTPRIAYATDDDVTVQSLIAAELGVTLLPALDVDYCAHAMVAVGVELGARLAVREPPDVEGATRFATTLFLAGVTRP